MNTTIHATDDDYGRAIKEIYSAMLEKLDGDESELSEILSDVARFGADQGVPGYTYYSECIEFYDAHELAIYAMLREDTEAFGYSNVSEFISTFARSNMLDDADGRKNLLTWYAIEKIASIEE